VKLNFGIYYFGREMEMSAYYNVRSKVMFVGVVVVWYDFTTERCSIYLMTKRLELHGLSFQILAYAWSTDGAEF
jgi:hypothetical protein